MESASKSKNAACGTPPKGLQQQILEMAPIVFEFIALIGYLFYYTLEAVYRKLFPIAPAPIREEIILVTGAGHGIGRELALVYASEGATVILWDIDEKNNEETANMIIKNGGREPFHYNCDVSDRKSVLATAKKIKEEVGEVTILINNAGIMPAHPLEKHTGEEIERIMNINVMAHFWTLEAFLPDMQKNNHGHIVALSSIAGVTGLKNLVPYCTSKFAVRGLMESLGDELMENPFNNVKTTTVCPFMVNTGLCKKPYVRFENALNLLDPKLVAREIMLAQRTGIVEFTIPRFLMTVNYVTRLFPQKAALKVKMFFESGIHSDL
ncbi:short-chain dehydrogenase/reductase family 16C member 6-like [Euwallacea similis]|uniref:short-chain dehydrogenase/reductase family 16C member 6-like n=1 Tax=Euwallacea similis TaxID=1736056 RepID=UPI00344E8E96